MTRRVQQRILFRVPRPSVYDGCVDSWYRSRGFQLLAGVDEAGRGALAGPVCAAAVMLGRCSIEGLDDSKRLTASRREELCEQIWAQAAGVGVAMVGPAQIDVTNILKAALEAMRLAMEALPERPDLVLVDGNQLPGWTVPSVALVKGDQRSKSIMAASIVAKVTRDEYMRRAGRDFPGWGFEGHKGYAVRVHIEALSELGLAPIHRRSFRPCRLAGE